MKQENILSVKLNKKDRSSIVNVSYFIPELNRNRNEEITDVPHRDFYTALEKLSSHLAYMFHSERDWSENYQATGFKRVKENIVLLTGRLIAPNNLVTGISTANINLDDDLCGFEEELSTDLENLSLEVLMLLNRSKLGITQLTIDDAIKDNEKEEQSIAPGELSEFEEKLNVEELDDEYNYHEDDPHSNDNFINNLM